MLKLYIPEGYDKLTVEQKTRICNGCGPAGWKYKLVPDKIWGCKITEACNIHDYCYHIGKTIDDKDEADRIFLNNMLRIIDFKTENWFLKFIRRKMAYRYYLAVSQFGGPAFWEGKNNMTNIYIIKEADNS